MNSGPGDESIDWTRRLDDALAAPAHAVRSSIRALLEELLALERGASEAHLTRVLDVLLGYAWDRSGPLARSRAADAAHLSRLLAALEVLRDGGLPHLGERAPDVLDEVRREARWLFEALDPDAPLPPPAERLKSALDGVVLSRLGSMSQDALTADRPARALQTLSEHVGESIAQRRRTALRNLSEERRAVWRGIFLRYRATEGATRDAFLRALAEDLEDRAQDALARVEDLPSAAAFRVLANTATDLRRGRALFHHAGAKAHRRRMTLLRHRVQAGLSARQVRAQQEQQLGPNLLRWVNRGVVGLIFLAIGLFFFEDSLNETFLLVADLAISGLLLGEFTWRFLLAKRAGRYLFRHLATDVLPALPFVALTAASHGSPFSFLRLLRLARPSIQTYRVLAFTARAIDRVGQENRSLLNRNIVLFEPDEGLTRSDNSQGPRLGNLHARLARALRLALRQSELEEGAVPMALVLRMDDLAARLETADLQQLTPGAEQPARAVRVEALVEHLLTLEPEVVEDWLGEESAGRVARFLGLFDQPILRHLPLLSSLARGVKGKDPYVALAQAGRSLGRKLDDFLDRLRCLDDLKGIVTGPELLDRVGGLLIKVSQRPAMRLILFGIGSLLLSWIAQFFSSLEGVSRFFGKVLGPTVIALGSVCLVLFALGQWLRRLADEATELLQQVAEAQGLNLLKLEKRSSKEHDRGELFDRIVAPELQLSGHDAEAVVRARAGFIRGDEPASLATKPGERRGPEVAAHEQVDFLYLDYLDGGILHKSNVKTTEQVLGNLDLAAVREERLEVGKKERKRLRRLDLDRERPIPTGPYLWFRFITESLAQRTARLVLSYNERLLPLAAHRHTDPRMLQAMESWVSGDGRRPTRSLSEAGLAWADATGGARFHALHFLSQDPKWVQRVAHEYGEAVAHRLMEDRKHLVREVFATRGWEQMAPSRRTKNPYRLFERHIMGGRFLLLPLKMTWFTLRSIGRAFGQFLKIVKEELARSKTLAHRAPPYATRGGVLRKIHRMHQPVFLEALDLRARIDPESLGLEIPGVPRPAYTFGSVAEDLAFVGAREDVREQYRDLAAASARALVSLRELLRTVGADQHGLLVALRQALALPTSTRRPVAVEAEARRALAIAWTIDWKSCRTHWEAEEELNQIARKVLALKERAPRRRFLLRRGRERAFQAWLQRSGRGALPRVLIERLRGAFAANRHDMERLVLVLDRIGGPVEAREDALRRLESVARDPRPWSRQLVAARAVQTLARLDLKNTSERVLGLAGLGDSDSA